MADIITYFIGAFEILFSYVNPIWHTDYNLQLTFIIVVSCFCAIVLTVSMLVLKHAFIAAFNAVRKM